MNKWIKEVVGLILLVSVVLVGYADNAQSQLKMKAIVIGKGAILQIVPTSHAPVTVPATGQVEVAYTVTNNASQPISQIIVNGNYNVPANLVTLNTIANNCSSLNSGASCQFTVGLLSRGVVGTTSLMPRVCGFNGVICSAPVAADRIAVNVTTTPTKTLKSITVIPASAFIQINGTQNFTAIGTYSDGSTAIITQAVTWHVANSNVASINASGVANGVGRGDTTVTATLGNITGQAALSVGIFAYVSRSNAISFCLRNSTGALTNCQVGTGGATFTNLATMALNSSGTNLYGANFSPTGAVYRCTINNNGSLNQCAVAISLSNPFNVAINATENLLYITRSSSVISYCTINTDGSLGACNTTGNTFVSARGIAFNPQGTIAYITDNVNNAVYYCPVNANGSLGTCTSTAIGSGFNSPLGLVVNSKNTIVYIVNDGPDQVLQCPINANGSLAICSITASGFNFPRFIALNPANTLAYVTDSFNSRVAYCGINANGSFGVCNFSSPGFTIPVGIALFH